MKLKKLLRLTLISMAFGAAPLAQAQFAGYQSGDLILVLWANNHDAVNYDLGSVSQFSSTASFTVSDFNAAIAESDLGVSSLSGLSFNLGSGAGAGTTPYVTDTVAPTISSTLSLNTVANGLKNYGTTIFSGNSGPNNDSIVPSTSTSAYDFNANGANEADWGLTPLSGSGRVYTSLPGAFGDGTTSGAAGINFYQLQTSGSGGDALLGDFILNDTGSLSFNGADVSAVPEPAAYGLLGGFGLLAVAFRRQLTAAI
jgi:PEP-CTERM motif